MKKLIAVCIFLIAFVGFIRAQEQFTLRQQADKLYERYEYFKSVNLYLKLAEKHNVSIEISERIADCYFNINRYEEAEKWYAAVVADVKASKISHYHYAEVLLRDKKFEEAKAQYKFFYQDNPNQLAFKLATCDSAALWMKLPSGYRLKNEDQLNTNYSDWGLTTSSKNSRVFTSDRITDEQKTDNRTGNGWFKLYQVTNGQVNELMIQTDSSSLFKDKYHTGPVAFTKNADTAYITVTTVIPTKQLTLDKRDKETTQRLYTRRLQLVIAAKRNGQWFVFKSFPYNDVEKYALSEAALSADGNTIYFSSDMAGGEGKTDLWYCQKRTDGSWDKPVNCGKSINSKEEEAFPVIGANGDLYFASKGLPGMGGYDIFQAKGEKANWSTPVNLKYPVNSTSDDFYFTTTDDLAGFLSSNREGGKGSDDIYSFSYKKPDTVPAKIITHIGTPSRQLLALNPIYYDLDKFIIRADAALELDKLIVSLKQHPQLRLEISSYTDSRASDNYNQLLSEKRSASVVAYLVKNGIEANRVTAKAYGENNLVNKCADGVTCTEVEQQLNRRTEFKVVESN